MTPFPSQDDDPETALTTAHAHARAAGALTAMVRCLHEPAEAGESRTAAEALSTSLQTLAHHMPADRSAIDAAARLATTRTAAGEDLSTNALRLIAEALADPQPAEPVAADLLRAVRGSSEGAAYLATAFSGLGLMSRALAGRHGRTLSLSVAAEGVLVTSDRLDDWRDAAMQMASFILDNSRRKTLDLAFEARAYGGAVSLSVNLPRDVRTPTAMSVAAQATDALDGPDVTAKLDRPAPAILQDLETIAARLGGSIAIDHTDGQERRLVLLSRAVRPRGQVQTEAGIRPARGVVARRAALRDAAAKSAA